MCVCSRNFGLEVNRIRTAALVPYAGSPPPLLSSVASFFRPLPKAWEECLNLLRILMYYGLHYLSNPPRSLRLARYAQPPAAPRNQVDLRQRSSGFYYHDAPAHRPRGPGASPCPPSTAPSSASSHPPFPRRRTITSAMSYAPHHLPGILRRLHAIFFLPFSLLLHLRSMIHTVRSVTTASFSTTVSPWKITEKQIISVQTRSGCGRRQRGRGRGKEVQWDDSRTKIVALKRIVLPTLLPFHL